MRNHEVPTHVQAEDRVLLWFTFPQIVALTAVCALSYGAYSYAPVGPSEVRMALAVVLGLAGVAMVVGKIGGRRLPLVAADLLRFWLRARRAGRGLRRLARRKRREGERRNGRTPFRPHGWFGKHRRREENDNTRQETRHRKSWLAVTALAAAVVAVPQPALADGHWQDEIEFEPPEPVPGRRIFVEGYRCRGTGPR